MLYNIIILFLNKKASRLMKTKKLFGSSNVTADHNGVYYQRVAFLEAFRSIGIRHCGCTHVLLCPHRLHPMRRIRSPLPGNRPLRMTSQSRSYQMGSHLRQAIPETKASNKKLQSAEQYRAAKSEQLFVRFNYTLFI